MARKRILDIENKKKRIDTGLSDIDIEANLTFEERIARRKKKFFKAKELAEKGSQALPYVS